jgi:hypothetical protein
MESPKGPVVNPVTGCPTAEFAAAVNALAAGRLKPIRTDAPIVDPTSGRPTPEFAQHLKALGAVFSCGREIDRLMIDHGSEE